MRSLAMCLLLWSSPLVAAAEPPTDNDPDIAKIVAEISRERLAETVRTLVAFGTRNTLSAQDDPKRGIGAARNWIRERLERCSTDAGSRLDVKLDSFVTSPSPRVPQPSPVVNVVATLTGDDVASRDRVLVVSGHYDSMCTDVRNATCDAPGADDDASGTAVSIELACVMARHRFPATIVFLAVAGEEQGLLGSAHFARSARERGMNIEAMITNDIVGASRNEAGVSDASYVRLFAEGVPAKATLDDAWVQRLATSGENDSPSRELARTLRDAAARYVPDFAVRLVHRRDRYLRGGDHIPFLNEGYAAVRFTEAHEDFRHQHQDVRVDAGVQYGDLPEFVDFDYLLRVARVNAAGLASLARAPTPPAGVRIETMRLENHTTLSWVPGKPDANLAGYEVVWRETTSALWQGAQFVGGELQVRLPLSKDDYIFSVRAVSRDGHRSLATYPIPLRTPAPIAPR
jgi:peptidase M28-like protein